MDEFKSELSKRIRGLNIEDKALESTIRELVFNHSEEKVEEVMTKWMPETKLKKFKGEFPKREESNPTKSVPSELTKR